MSPGIRLRVGAAVRRRGHSGIRSKSHRRLLTRPRGNVPTRTVRNENDRP